MTHASLRTRTLSQPKHRSKRHRSNGYDKPLPILFAKIQLSEDSADNTLIKVLVDSGASETVARRSLLKALRKKKLRQKVIWTTTAGDFTTDEVAVTNFSLPELNPTMTITADVHLVESLGQYDIPTPSNTPLTVY